MALKYFLFLSGTILTLLNYMLKMSEMQPSTMVCFCEMDVSIVFFFQGWFISQEKSNVDVGIASFG
jgi:hypothetical protein